MIPFVHTRSIVEIALVKRLGASFLSLLKGDFQYDSPSIAVGFFSSFFFGLLAIHLTNHLIKLKKYWLFSIYCFIIAIIIFVKGII